MERKYNHRSRVKADLAAVLRKSWYHLRLSVRHPARVPTWDAIVLTAASPEQAQLYEWQLKRAKRMGRIADSTVTLAVPDPHGQRIGSGAATLHAIMELAKHYQQLSLESQVPILKLYREIQGFKGTVIIYKLQIFLYPNIQCEFEIMCTRICMQNPGISERCWTKTLVLFRPCQH